MPALPGKPPNRGKNLAEREVIRWNRQRTETQRHLCEKYSLENQILKAEVLKKSELVKGLAMIADAITTRIMDSDLSRSAKEDILREIASIPLVLEELARAQTRLRRGNEARPESEGEES